MDNNTFTKIKEAMSVIDELGFIDVVSKYEDKEKGFMFSDSTEIIAIGNALAFQSHSGASFAYVLRSCQYFFNNPTEWDIECSHHISIDMSTTPIEVFVNEDNKISDSDNMNTYDINTNIKTEYNN
jgi:hypothetical protein